MQEFNFLKYHLCFTKPDMIENPEGWVEHIPFAFFLIEILKPSTVVELGTHTGNSFNAFCQAVKTLNIEAKCYAVDTWLGDQHAGFYQDSVYKTLAEYQDKNYKSFARLMKMTFDDAVVHFNNESIDLLHIDGLHTYEAVKHDFYTWLPKMSGNGVVVFHDTCVTRDDFGVWKLWDELSTKYPSYNFKHGYGLGILAVGKNVPDEFTHFIRAADDNIFFLNFFEKLGRYVQNKNQLCQVQSELNRVLNSRAWRWGNKITGFVYMIAPAKTLRRKIIKLIFFR